MDTNTQEILALLEGKISEDIEEIDTHRFYMEDYRIDLVRYLYSGGDIKDDEGKSLLKKMRYHFDQMYRSIAGLDLQLSYLPEEDED